MSRLTNRVAIVTGAGRGIGRAISERFGAEGAKVLLVDRHFPDAAGLCQSGMVLHEDDVVSDGAAARIVDLAIARFGGVDILVNNAGIVRHEPISQPDESGWNDSVLVNLTAPKRLCQAALAPIKRSGSGRVINIASVNAVRGAAGLAAYSASKAGIIGLTKVLAIEFGCHGITCNAILPGAILTDINREVMEQNAELRSRFENFTPFGRLGRPDEIAGAAAFLASDDASFVNGHCLAVDGGYLAQV